MKKKGFRIGEQFVLIALLFLVVGFVFGNASSVNNLFWRAVLACFGFFVLSFVIPYRVSFMKTRPGDNFKSFPENDSLLVRLMEFLGLLLSIGGWVLIEDFFSETIQTIGLVIVILGMTIFWFIPEFLELLLKIIRRRFERKEKAGKT